VADNQRGRGRGAQTGNGFTYPSCLAVIGQGLQGHRARELQSRKCSSNCSLTRLHKVAEKILLIYIYEIPAELARKLIPSIISQEWSEDTTKES